MSNSFTSRNNRHFDGGERKIRRLLAPLQLPDPNKPSGLKLGNVGDGENLPPHVQNRLLFSLWRVGQAARIGIIQNVSPRRQIAVEDSLEDGLDLLGECHVVEVFSTNAVLPRPLTHQIVLAAYAVIAR